nr:MAG TPA: hypothetical protein [Caudoviricetes sp.]
MPKKFKLTKQTKGRLKSLHRFQTTKKGKTK